MRSHQIVLVGGCFDLIYPLKDNSQNVRKALEAGNIVRRQPLRYSGEIGNGEKRTHPQYTVSSLLIGTVDNWTWAIREVSR